MSNQRRYASLIMLLLIFGTGVLLTPSSDSLPRSVAAPYPKDLPKFGKLGDYLMFGGTPARNMVNLVEKNIPDSFDLKTDVLWKAQLGTTSFGGPVIANGKVFVPTAGDAELLQRYTGPRPFNPRQNYHLAVYGLK